MELLVKFEIVTECQHSFFFVFVFCRVQASKFWGWFLTLDNQSITFTAMMIGVSECMKTAWSDWKPAKLEIGNWKSDNETQIIRSASNLSCQCIQRCPIWTGRYVLRMLKLCSYVTEARWLDRSACVLPISMAPLITSSTSFQTVEWRFNQKRHEKIQNDAIL